MILVLENLPLNSRLFDISELCFVPLCFCHWPLHYYLVKEYLVYSIALPNCSLQPKKIWSLEDDDEDEDTQPTTEENDKKDDDDVSVNKFFLLLALKNLEISNTLVDTSRSL